MHILNEIIITILFINTTISSRGYFFSWFKGHTCGIWNFTGYKSKQSFSCCPTLQPQQYVIREVSPTYTIPQCNARARPGIGPTSSWVCVGFLTTEPWWEIPHSYHFCFVVKKLRTYSCSIFQAHNTVIVTTLSFRSSELNHLMTESLYPFDGSF